MAGPKSSSAPVGAALADSLTAARDDAGNATSNATSNAHTAHDALAARAVPDAATSTRRSSPAPVEALSAYEEELLRAYSPTLAGTYERWKEEGEGMPLVLSVMLRQWRTAGCPGERLPDGHDASSGTSSATSSVASAGTSSYTSSFTSSDDTALNSGHHSSLHFLDDSCASSRGAHDSHSDMQSDHSGDDDCDDDSSEPCYHDACPDCPKAGCATTKKVTPTVTGSATAAATAKVAKSPLLRESPPRPKADKKSDKNAQMTLPGVSVPRTPGETAPMSNYLARTSLFAPIRKGRRVMHDKQMLHSPEGIDVLYTGKQLDMADQDVYLTALRLAGGIKAGDRILINRAAFLRMLGYKHNPGARDYKWLEESFYRISTGRVIIKAKHIEANLPLMGALLTDTRSGDYYFTIPRETYALWAKNLYSYIDLEKRHALERNVPLSKWLQSYAQSHAPGTHTISMDLLHLWCGYGGRLRDFRDSLTGALEELTRVGILTSWSIQERGKGRQKKIMISWVRERTHRDDAPPPLVEE